MFKFPVAVAPSIFNNVLCTRAVGAEVTDCETPARVNALAPVMLIVAIVFALSVAQDTVTCQVSTATRRNINYRIAGRCDSTNRCEEARYGGRR